MKAFDGCEFAVNPTSPSSLMDFEPWQLIELIDHLSLVSVQPKDESTGRRRKETAETLHENLDPADEAGLPLLPPSPAKRTQSPAKMKRTLPGKMGKSTSFLVPQDADDLHRAVDALITAVDRELDNNNWASVDQAWATFDSAVSGMPAELDADLLSLLPHLAPRAVEALCSHKSVSTTVVNLLENLSARLGAEMGPFFKSTFPGWENLMLRAGLSTHGPGGRAVERLMAMAPSAPFHEVLPWLGGLMENGEAFKKNVTARERVMKVAVAFAREVLAREDRKPADLKAAEHLVRLTCEDSAVAVREGAKELWNYLREYQAEEKLRIFLAGLSERGREILTLRSPTTAQPPATPRGRSVSGSNRPLSTTTSRSHLPGSSSSSSLNAPATPRTTATPRVSNSNLASNRTPVASASPRVTTTNLKNPPSKLNTGLKPTAAGQLKGTSAPRAGSSLTPQRLNSKLPQSASAKSPAPASPHSSGTTVSLTVSASSRGSSPVRDVSPWSRSSGTALSPRSLDERHLSPVSADGTVGTSAASEPAKSSGPRSPSRSSTHSNSGATSRPAPSTPKAARPVSKIPSIGSIPSSARSSKSSLSSVRGTSSSAWAKSPGRTDSTRSIELSGRLATPRNIKPVTPAAPKSTNVFDQTLADLDALLTKAASQAGSPSRSPGTS